MATKNDDVAQRVIAEAKAARQQWDKSYRGMALRIFPPICGRCGREFEGKRLRELTVHHKDGNHDNNPPDGSNWELLCIYCHENEHGSTLDFYERGDLGPTRDGTPPLRQRPFEKLAELLAQKDKSKD